MQPEDEAEGNAA